MFPFHSPLIPMVSPTPINMGFPFAQETSPPPYSCTGPFLSLVTALTYPAFSAETSERHSALTNSQPSVNSFLTTIISPKGSHFCSLDADPHPVCTHYLPFFLLGPPLQEGDSRGTKTHRKKTPCPIREQNTKGRPSGGDAPREQDLLHPLQREELIPQV